VAGGPGGIASAAAAAVAAAAGAGPGNVKTTLSDGSYLRKTGGCVTPALCSPPWIAWQVRTTTERKQNGFMSGINLTEAEISWKPEFGE
jgi:hypothetical protein